MRTIQGLVIANGFKFTFMYLKEAFRLTVRALSGSPTTSGFGNKIRVGTDPWGFPHIIPLPLRIPLRDAKSNVVICRLVLTLIQIYRVFPVKVSPDLGTILDPFKGISKTLLNEEVALAVKTLGLRLRFSSFRGLISEKSGPNGRRATWNSLWDAFAFLHEPYVLFNYYKLAYISKSY